MLPLFQLGHLIERFFILPIKEGTGYNLVNSLVYGLVLVAAVFLLHKFFVRMRIKIDKNFFFATLPFVLFGSLIRVLEDAGIVKSYWLMSPLIWFIVFMAAFSSMLAGIMVQKKFDIGWYKVMGVVGFCILAYPLFLLGTIGIQNIYPLIKILGITTIWSVLFFGLVKFDFLSTQNAGVLVAHMLDASATYVAMGLGYWEQHPLPALLIGTFGPGAMFLLKIAVVLPILLVLDRYMADKKDKEMRTWLKIVILILGLAPGVRDAARIAMGV